MRSDLASKSDYASKSDVASKSDFRRKKTLDDLNEGHVEESIDQVLSEKFVPHLQSK